MNKQTHSPKLENTIKSRKNKRRRLLIVVVLGVVIALLVPVMFFQFATNPIAELSPIKIQEEAAKSNDLQLAESKYYTVYISEKSYLWMEGQYEDSAKISALVEQPITDWIQKRSGEPSLIIIKTLPGSRFESIEELLDSLSQYPSMKYAIKEVSSNEKQELSH